MVQENKPTVQLKVSEAKQRDVGKGRARIDVETMHILGITAGDLIELTSKKTTVAIVWPLDSEDHGLKILRIDGQTRKNGGIRLNELVEVRKIKSKNARSVTLEPVGTKINLDNDFSEFVRNRLIGFPITLGDDISITILGSPIIFNVSKIRPKGVLRIERTTRIIILEEPNLKREISSTITYDEIGGLKEEISRLREIVELPLRHPELFQRIGIEAPKGVLLYGPPGCGKTLLAKALANECEASILSINGPEIMNKYYGETEAKLREIFKEARSNVPSIIFIDEIDAIAPKREDVFGDVEKRVVAQILALMDGLSDRGDVVIIGATNRPESIDPALRRPGRFDREVEIGVPNIEDRLEILQIHTRGMPLDKSINLIELSKILHGYTGADLKSLCREAGLRALRRTLPNLDVESESIPPETLETIHVNINDFSEARKEIIPTAMREFYVETPSLRFIDIGGLEDIKKKIMDNVVFSIRNPAKFSQIGVKPLRGILMYGPPGCGKTLLARAIATESTANFITVKGPEILSKWVGESEKAIREIFRKAKNSAPCIIFFDEIDSIGFSRSIDEEIGVERVLSQLLTEIDGIYNVGDIFVIAATNRPDLLDSSLIRPGRFDLPIYIYPPNEDGRKEILKIITKKMPLENEVYLNEISKKIDGFTGADIEALCREAAISAISRNSNEVLIRSVDFDYALKNVKPSVNQELISWYISIYENISNRIRENLRKNIYS